MKSNKFWLLILGGVVVASAVIAVLIWQAPAIAAPAEYARIYIDGKLTRTVNITDDKDLYRININSNGGFNVLEVERGRIRMLSATCPDGICIRQGWKSGGVMPIVCLPNRVVVAFEGGSTDAGVDAVVG